MEALAHTLSPVLNAAGAAVVIVGMIYLGMTFAHITRGGAGDIVKAFAIIIAGGCLIGFSSFY